jgi:GNAT superfamily N-acetyltransferase
VIVRRATSRDLDAVVALRLALLREYPDHPIYGRLRSDAESRARPLFASQLDADSEAIFLAEESDSAVGLLRCVDTAASPLLVPERYCYVSSVYVRPDRRRQGVLQRLIEAARAWCQERGLSEMRLHNVGTRASAAAAWDALGFEVVEQVRVMRLASDRRPAVARETQRAPASHPRPGGGASGGRDGGGGERRA